MSEPSPPAPVPGTPTLPPARKSSWKYTLALVAVLVAVAGGYYFYEKSRNPTPPPVDELAGLKEYLSRVRRKAVGRPLRRPAPDGET